MYTSRTGIVYIYKINVILSYPLMASTLTIRPKIKTGNPSHNSPSKKNHLTQKFFTPTPPHKLYKIHTQFTKIIKKSSTPSSTKPLHINAR